MIWAHRTGTYHNKARSKTFRDNKKLNQGVHFYNGEPVPPGCVHDIQSGRRVDSLVPIGQSVDNLETNQITAKVE